MNAGMHQDRLLQETLLSSNIFPRQPVESVEQGTHTVKDDGPAKQDEQMTMAQCAQTDLRQHHTIRGRRLDDHVKAIARRFQFRRPRKINSVTIAVH
jgi:hypothetical protein